MAGGHQRPYSEDQLLTTVGQVRFKTHHPDKATSIDACAGGVIRLPPAWAHIQSSVSPSQFKSGWVVGNSEIEGAGQLMKNRYLTRNQKVTSVMAFHEKAGRSQVDSFVFFIQVFSAKPATVAMLPSALSRSESFRSVHIGRSRFSRCCHLISDLSFHVSGTWPRPLTQSPELGFGFYFFSSWTILILFLPFCVTQLPLLSCDCCCAMARTLLR